MNGLQMNGRKRPTLNDQIVRLDSILDGLAENLNEAVADAVKAAVGLAVKEAIQSIVKEVMTNKEVLARLLPEMTKNEEAVPVKQEKQSGLWLRRAGLAMAAWEIITNTVKMVRDKTLVIANQSFNNVGKLADSCWKSVWIFGKEYYSRLKRLPSQAWNSLRLGVELGRQFKKPLLIALVVGGLVGAGCYLAGPVVASAISGIAGFCGSLIASARKAFQMVTYLEIEKGNLNQTR